MSINTDKIREYFNNVSNGLLLSIGLVVVAGLIAATFIYGDENGSQAGQNNDNGQIEGTINDETNGEEAAGTEDQQNNGTNSEEEGTNDEGIAGTVTDGQAGPAEIAATGPESLTALMASILGILTFGYFHTQSKIKSSLLG